jgi:CRISPR/Cas system-associated protein endoribonuclease Cas2
MGAIINRIVNIDAPVTTLAEQISVNMLRARRSERDYFLLQDSAYLQTNRQALDTIKQTVAKIDELAPEEQSATRAILKAVEQYEQHFGTAVSLLEQPGATTAQRVQDSVAAYETDLNDLLRHAKRTGAAQLVREVSDQPLTRKRVWRRPHTIAASRMHPNRRSRPPVKPEKRDPCRPVSQIFPGRCLIRIET